MLPGSGGREADECVSTGPGRWQVSARGGLSHQPGLVLAPRLVPGPLGTQSAHHRHPGETGPGASPRGGEGVGLRGRSLVVNRAGTLEGRISPGEGVGGEGRRHTLWPGWGWALRNFSGVSPVLERVFLREGLYQAKDLLICKVGGLGP